MTNILTARAALKTIEWAQNDFREKNHGNYWRKDIAGLHPSLKNSGNLPDPIVLADDRPVSDLYSHKDSMRAPYEGKFWVRAIRLPDEKEPNPNRFAACCFPAEYGPGIRSHYVINQNGVVFRKDLGHGKGIDVYPLDPIKDGWIDVDAERNDGRMGR